MPLPEMQIDQYVHSPETLAMLSSTPTVRLLGPFAVGKTTIIRKVTEIDHAFIRVRGFSSRELRPDEAKLAPEALPHRPIHTPEEWGWLGRELARGAIAHIMHHPWTGHVMGSAIDEYQDGTYPVIDLSYAAVDELPSALPPYVLVTAPESWQRWAEDRRGLPDYTQRVDDARDCLEWGLNTDDAVWILNSDGHPEEAAHAIISIARGENEADPANKRYGEALLRSLVA